MWGWATWRRSSALVDYDLSKWKKLRSKYIFLQKRIQPGIFTNDVSWVEYWKKHFDLTTSGDINTWDYQWIFAQLNFDLLSIFPSCNLIKNIGFTEKATHTCFPDHAIAALPLQSLPFPIRHPQRLKRNKTYEAEYLKKVWFSYNKESLLKFIKIELYNIPLLQKMNNVLKKAVS
jgi:hypothetical protein